VCNSWNSLACTMQNCRDMNTKASNVKCSPFAEARNGGCEMCLPRRSVGSPMLSLQPCLVLVTKHGGRRNSIECAASSMLVRLLLVLYEKWLLTSVFFQSLMKHAGKNNIRNVNSLTLGDEKPKIDTGQKINSNHHIGSNPAQVSHKIYSVFIRMRENIRISVQQTRNLNGRALCHICLTYVICLSTLLRNILCLCVCLFVGVNNSSGCLTLTYSRQLL
jgi:hypothetical protein